MKNTTILPRSAILVLGLAILSGCSNAKEQLGLTKKSPDEFAVMKRAPLAMPPEYNLRPPVPGAPRPQEQETSEQARQAMFGEQAASADNSYEISSSPFLARAGAGKADPGIRQKVDAEAIDTAKDNVPVAKKIFGLGGKPEDAPATVVDAKEEAARLKKNEEEGKPVTEGETPSVKR